MKPLCLFMLFLTLYAQKALSQQVIIKGTLRCMNNGVATSTRGAINIIIIPSFNPGAAVATTTTPQGFFEINTGWPAADLKDKSVTLYILTKCSSCQRIQRVFITEDLDKRNTDPSKLFVTVKNWKILENCSQVELPDLASEKLLDSAHHLPPQNISGKATGTVAMSPVSFINLVQKLANIAAAAPNVGLFQVTSINAGKIKHGEFLHSSVMTNTDNTGFNFAPGRNLSEAVFWNASAIATSYAKNNISFLGNFKNNFKLSGFHQITPRFFLGAGGIYTKQDQINKLSVTGVGPGNSDLTFSDINHPEKLEEFAAFLAPVFKINNRVSAALTIKSIWQQFNNPNLISMETDSDNKPYNMFQDDSVRKQAFDADLSVTYKITSYLQAGASVMNVAGTKLYGAQFVPDSSARSYVNQRAYGVGLCYKYGRLNIGVDALFTDNDFYDASLGVNYVPFNNGLIAAGYAFKQQSFSISFLMKHFKIGYIYDNGLMINDVKRAKTKLFDGKIYSGFVFNF